MRMGLAIAALLVLQGCGGGGGGAADGNSASGSSFAQGFDDGFKKSFRQKFVEQCVSTASQSGKAVDFTPICSCVADGVMKGKTVRQLMDGPSDAEQEAVLKACQAKHPVT
ncbi:hypothetical protein OF829_08320 [Sphingomonas sp. LB-2]|uniref:hypothetical protein n=1 Tax=Sphingomonas caeni TaxID=2984949 RepID=UPI0022316418|nr:hypothetical protein [Sphingomonas caeni]MCW3847244.1 hypothetical protein [Sphingomonas caeni]